MDKIDREELELMNELGECECGTFYWTRWHIDMIYMQKCAPCYFDKFK